MALAVVVDGGESGGSHDLDRGGGVVGEGGGEGGRKGDRVGGGQGSCEGGGRGFLIFD